MLQKSITHGLENSISYERPQTRLPSFALGFNLASPRVNEYSTTTSIHLPGAMTVSIPNLSLTRSNSPSAKQVDCSLFPPRSFSDGSNTISIPNTTIDANASPLLSDRSHNYVGFPAGYSLPAPYPLRSNFPRQPTSTPSDGREKEWIPQALVLQSASPSTSYPSNSQLSRTSPALLPYSSATTHACSFDHCGPNATRTSPPEGSCLSCSSDTSHGRMTGVVGQAAVQFMTLTTDQGLIQIPVDVQAASKMADKKRKRNAGASARFRQRRKEKEQKSSQTIAELESRVRQLCQEMEYYRAERNYFRGIVSSRHNLAQPVPRLPSPRQSKGPKPGSNGHILLTKLCNGLW